MCLQESDNDLTQEDVMVLEPEVQVKVHTLPLKGKAFSVPPLLPVWWFLHFGGPAPMFTQNSWAQITQELI